MVVLLLANAHTRSWWNAPVMVPCSPSAHARTIRFEAKGGAPSMCAVELPTGAFLSKRNFEARSMRAVEDSQAAL